MIKGSVGATPKEAQEGYPEQPLVRLRFLILAMLVMVLLLVLAAAAIRTEQLRARSVEQDEKLEEAIADYEARMGANPWTPRPLRGASHPGNIFTEELEAAGKIDVPSSMFRGRAVSRCEPPSPAQVQLIEDERAALVELRRAASAEYSRAPLDLGRGALLAKFPDVGVAFRAQQLLLVQSKLVGPPACAEIVADALRLGQAVSPGGALFTAKMSATMVEAASFAMADCLRGADEITRQRAARELVLAAEDHPTLGAGYALEAEHLLFAAALRPEWKPFDFIVPVDEQQREDFWVGGEFLEARALYARQFAAARAITDAPTSEAVEGWEKLLAEQAASDNLVFAFARASTQWLPDLRALAALRVVTVFAQRLADPSATVRLRDAFSDAPLIVDDAVAGQLRVWSVGPNGVDERGAGDDLAVEQWSRCVE